MTVAEVRVRHRIDVPVFMILFHMGFLLLGLIGLFLMASRVVPFDPAASLAVLIAVLFNVLFGILWAGQISRKTPERHVSPPSVKAERLSSMVSFVIVAHDDEQTIARCIDGVFKAAVEYRGPSEIIVMDDGSSDNTYETAWAKISSEKQGLASVPVKVVKNLAHLGKTECARIAVNKSSGEYIALVDAKTMCDPVQVAAVTSRICPTPERAEDVGGADGLFSAESLRRLLS